MGEAALIHAPCSSQTNGDKNGKQRKRRSTGGWQKTASKRGARAHDKKRVPPFKSIPNEGEEDGRQAKKRRDMEDGGRLCNIAGFCVVVVQRAPEKLEQERAREQRISSKRDKHERAVVRVLFRGPECCSFFFLRELVKGKQSRAEERRDEEGKKNVTVNGDEREKVENV